MSYSQLKPDNFTKSDNFTMTMQCKQNPQGYPFSIPYSLLKEHVPIDDKWHFVMLIKEKQRVTLLVDGYVKFEDNPDTKEKKKFSRMEKERLKVERAWRRR